MGTKRKKKKRRGGSGGGSRGGAMSGLRGGFKGVVGQGPRRKESSLSKVLSWALLAAAIGVLAYRLLS
jgi:hypothetical protein